MPLPNIGPGELILILIIALVVLGPGKLPDVAASLGKSVREFRRAATDVTDAGKLDAPAATTTQPATPIAPVAPAASVTATPAASEPAPATDVQRGDAEPAAPAPEATQSGQPARDSNLS